MKILYVTFASRAQFLERLGAGSGAEGECAADLLRVSTRARYTEGERVILEIGVPGLPNRVLVRMVAVETPDTGEQWFRFAPGEEHQRDFLIAVASGKAKATQRRHRRFPLRMRARVVGEGGEELAPDAETEEVGSGGLSLKTSAEVPEGARVTVVLEPLDGSGAIEFCGRVSGTRGDPGSQEIGVQFDSLAGEQMKRLRWMIRDVKLRGETPESEE